MNEHDISICPECGTELDCLAVIGADKSRSGRTERLYLCRKCPSYWETSEDADGGNRTELSRCVFR